MVRRVFRIRPVLIRIAQHQPATCMWNLMSLLIGFYHIQRAPAEFLAPIALMPVCEGEIRRITKCLSSMEAFGSRDSE